MIRPTRKPNLAERKTPIEEILHRVRRMETRQVTDLKARGVDTPSQRPIFFGASERGPACVRAPSVHSSIDEIMSAIPRTTAIPVEIYVVGELVGTLTLAPS